MATEVLQIMTPVTEQGAGDGLTVFMKSECKDHGQRAGRDLTETFWPGTRKSRGWSDSLRQKRLGRGEGKRKEEESPEPKWSKR